MENKFRKECLIWGGVFIIAGISTGWVYDGWMGAQVLAGSLLALIVPGWIWTYSLFSEKLDSVDRLIFAGGLSMSFSMVISFLLNTMGVALNSKTVFAALSLLILCGGVAFAWSRKKGFEDKGNAHFKTDSAGIALVGVALTLMLAKVVFVLLGYRYLPWGFDSVRVLEAINETVYTGWISEFRPPRVGLIYEGAWMRWTTGMSATDGLAIPLLLNLFLGGGLVYLLAKEISSNKKVGILAFLFFGLATGVPYAHESSFYGFVMAPLFWIVFLKYVKGYTTWLTLLLVSLAMFWVYPVLAMSTLLTGAVPCFIQLMRRVAQQDGRQAKRYANYFAILPLVFLSSFLFSNALVHPTYKGLGTFLNRSFGFWTVDVDRSILNFVFVGVVIGVGMLFFIPYLGRHADKPAEAINQSLERFKNRLLQLLNHKRVVQAMKIFVGIVLLDMVVTLGILYVSRDVVGDLQSWRILKRIFGPILKGEIWNLAKISYLTYFSLAMAGAVLLYQKKLHHKYEHFWFLFVPLGIAFLGLIPGPLYLENVFLSEKALNGLNAIVYSLAACTGWVLVQGATKRLQKASALIVSLVILFSISASAIEVKENYSYGIADSVIHAAQWLENQEDEDQLFVLNLNFFEPDVDANDQVFYGLSFIQSLVPFSIMLEVNQDAIVEKSFEKFKQIIQDYDVRYVLVEERYPVNSINKSLAKLGKVVFEEKSTQIIEVGRENL